MQQPIPPYDNDDQPIDGTVKVFVMPDDMEALLTVYPPQGGGQPVTFEKAMQALKAAGVVEGISPAAVSEALAPENWERSIRVARGVPPVDGEDARLDYHFPLPEERIKPTELEDGRVDFKNINLICNVRRGDTLVTRTPAKQGSPGITVKGRPIPPKAGKHLALPRGKNTAVDDTGHVLYATRDGHVSVTLGKVSVLPVFEVTGNVDYSVGNIDFLGNVLITGNIVSGFSVKAEGDIEIYGVVESAYVEAGGNIVVKNGIVGSGKAVVKAGGSVYSRFIENATVIAGQDVVAGNSIVQSTVRADRSVTLARRKGTIVGGLIQAGEEISCSVIGSPLGVQTSLEVGILPRVREEYKQVCASYLDKKKELDTLSAQIEANLKLVNTAAGPVSNRRKAVLYNSQDQYRILRAEFQQLEQHKQRLEQLIERNLRGTVSAREIAYPGTKVVINRAAYRVTAPIQFAIFTLDEGEIRFQSLR